MLSSAKPFQDVFGSSILRLVLIISLLLSLCSCGRTFDDPAKEARYKQYLGQVQLEIDRYNDAIWQTPTPIVRILKRFDVLKIVYKLDDVDLDQLSPAQAQQLRTQVTELVRGANRERDLLVRLLGLFVHRACRLNPAQLTSFEFTEPQLLLYRDVCTGVSGIQYRSSGLENMQALLDDLIPLITTSMREQKADLRPYVAAILRRKRWLNTERLFANAQLQVWSATRHVKSVPLPDEFRDYEIDRVGIVLGKIPRKIFSFEAFLQLDIYGAIALEPCKVLESERLEQILACRQLAMHIAEHSQSFTTIKLAAEMIDELDGPIAALNAKAGPLSPAITQRLAVLAKLDEAPNPLVKSGDLKTLKRRLQLIRRHGSFWLVQHLAKSRRN